MPLYNETTEERYMVYISLIYNLSLLISLSIISSFISRYGPRNRVLMEISQGILFGVITVVGMTLPLELFPGIFFDGRSVVLPIASFFFGPIAMLISAGFAIIYRIYAGGGGAFAGVLVIASSAIIGLASREFYSIRKRQPSIRGLILITYAVHIILLLLMFTLPKENVMPTIKAIAVPALIFFPATFVIISRIFLDEEERKKTLDELKKSESTLQKIFDILPVGLWIADKNGKLIRGNPEGVRIWGAEPTVNPSEYGIFKAKRLSGGELIRPDDWALALSINKGITIKDELLEIEAFDGVKRIVLNYTSPVKNDSGDTVGAIVVNQDVTDLMDAEEMLRKREIFLRETQRLTRVGGWEWDIENDRMYWTDEVFRIHGITDEQRKNNSQELIDQSAQCYDEKDRTTILEAFNRCAKEGIPYDLRFPLTTYDGRKIRIRTSAYPVLNNDRIVKVIGNIVDITEQVNSEEAVEKERELLRVTLNNIADGVMSVDLSGGITMMNNTASEMLAVKRLSFIGKQYTDVFSEISAKTREPLASMIEETLKRNIIVESDESRVLVNREGREYLLSEICSPIRDKNSNVIGAVLVFRDMTEKNRISENIKRSDKLNALGTLAGGIAHDFNNLLNGMFGYIELAKKFSDDRETVNKYLDESMLVFSRAKDLTRQILTFSKGGDPVKKVHSFSKLISESAKFASSGSKTSIELKIDKKLYNGSYDENQLFQVLDNIIINANQAMPLGGEITIEAKNVKGKDVSIIDEEHWDKDFVMISVRDTGVGVPSSMIPHIFDPFFTTKQQGTGLGLATVYSIIKRHDGYIDLESKIDKGTTFYIYLPAVKESVCESGAESLSAEEATGRVLIMDDEPSIRETTKKLLEGIGFEVYTSTKGEEALGIIEEMYGKGAALDVIILDLTVPGGMGGADVISKAREKFKDAVIIASSGYSEDPIMSDPAAYGFSDSIAKPYRIKSLLNLIAKNRRK